MAKDPYQGKPMEPVSSKGGGPSGKIRNDSAGRVTTSKGGSSVAGGDLSPRTSFNIINGK